MNVRPAYSQEKGVTFANDVVQLLLELSIALVHVLQDSLLERAGSLFKKKETLSCEKSAILLLVSLILPERKSPSTDLEYERWRETRQDRLEASNELHN